MSIGTILVCSMCASGGYYLGSQKFLFSLLVFVLSICVLFTASVGWLFGSEVLTALLQAQ